MLGEFIYGLDTNDWEIGLCMLDCQLHPGIKLG